MAADRVDRHGALFDQQRAHPCSGQGRLFSSISAAWSAALLTGTKRIPGRLIAAQIPTGQARGLKAHTGSIASFLLRLTPACAGGRTRA
jgi:hypothetical protein